MTALQLGPLGAPEIWDAIAGGCAKDVTPFFAVYASVYAESRSWRSGAGFAAIRKKIGETAWPDVQMRLLAAVAKRIPEGGAEFSAEALLSVGSR